MARLRMATLAGLVLATAGMLAGQDKEKDQKVPPAPLDNTSTSPPTARASRRERASPSPAPE